MTKKEEYRDLTEHPKRDKCLLWMVEKNPKLREFCKLFDLKYETKRENRP